MQHSTMICLNKNNSAVHISFCFKDVCDLRRHYTRRFKIIAMKNCGLVRSVVLEFLFFNKLDVLFDVLFVIFTIILIFFILTLFLLISITPFKILIYSYFIYNFYTKIIIIQKKEKTNTKTSWKVFFFSF